MDTQGVCYFLKAKTRQLFLWPSGNACVAIDWLIGCFLVITPWGNHMTIYVPRVVALGVVRLTDKL